MLTPNKRCDNPSAVRQGAYLFQVCVLCVGAGELGAEALHSEGTNQCPTCLSQRTYPIHTHAGVTGQTRLGGPGCGVWGGVQGKEEVGGLGLATIFISEAADCFYEGEDHQRPGSNLPLLREDCLDLTRIQFPAPWERCPAAASRRAQTD